jgi:hypothetical protein
MQYFRGEREANGSRDNPQAPRMGRPHPNCGLRQRLAQAVHRGVDRYLMLGAGLDGFSYRSLLMAQLQALEVDHLVVVVHY